MRTGTIERNTTETAIAIHVNLDGTGAYDVSTGIGFLDHMVEQFSRHSLIDVTMKVRGDLHVDQHHTTEDSAIALGQAIAQALGDKAGIGRYGAAWRGKASGSTDARSLCRRQSAEASKERRAAAIHGPGKNARRIRRGVRLRFLCLCWGGLAVEIEVTDFFNQAAPMDYSASAAERTTRERDFTIDKPLARDPAAAVRHPSAPSIPAQG